MGKIESFANQPVGSGQYNVGQMIGAAGAGIGAVKQRRTTAKSWDTTAAQFEGLGQEGMKVAEMIRSNPQMADMHAKRMGGWSSLYNTIRTGHHRAQLADQIVKAGEDDLYTGEEKQQIGLDALRFGINPAYPRSLMETGMGDFEATLNQLSPHVYDPHSLVEARQIYHQTGDPHKAIDVLIEREDRAKGYPTGSTELMKNHIRLREMRRTGQTGTPEYRDLVERNKQLTREAGQGGLTDSQKNQAAEIMDARRRLKKMLSDEKKVSRDELFGEIGNYFNATKNPYRLMLLRRSIQKAYGESDESFSAWLDWIEKNAPETLSAVASEPDFSAPGGSAPQSAIPADERALMDEIAGDLAAPNF
jgi:hypothetical protein